ncbi:MAG: PH domain-containing protein [Clostridiales bacterium]|nr:PH domain-containing protein [Clostridiales bacterium]
MKFKSKIDWWFHMLVLICLLASAFPIVLGIIYSIISSLIIGAAVMIALGGVIVLPIYFNTYYTLEDTKLHIRSGLCINKRIPYQYIEGIKETRDPAASAGLSLDRIEIRYSSQNMILVSPKDKQEFIRQLNQRMLKLEGKGNEGNNYYKYGENCSKTRKQAQEI